MGARHRVSKLLLRRGLVFDGPGETWSHAPPGVAVEGALRAAARRGRLRRVPRPSRGAARAPRPPRPADRSSSPLQGPWAPTVARLRCLRGVDTLTAVGLVAEIGDITAFKHPKQLSSYLGLVPSEQSSGTKRRQGSITKAGSSHARRLLVEAAWHYRRPPRVSLTLKRRQAEPATGGDRRRVARAAAAASPLGAPRRRARQETHDRRGRRRTRARVLRLGDRPTTRLTPDHHPVRGGGGGRRSATRDPRSRYEHQPRLARSILDRGPGAAQNRHEVASPRISA